MEKNVELLQKLGLTPSQAKVYLALATLGTSTARRAYKVAQVARQDIYRILIELQQIGLVEKIILTPTMFKALPLRYGVSILLGHKIKETAELKVKARELMKNAPATAKPSEHLEDAQFVYVPKKAIMRRVEKEINKSQKTFDLILSWEKFSNWMFHAEEVVQKLVEKGVKIRYITEKPKDENAMPKIVTEIASENNPLLKGRYILNVPLVHFAVIDDKEVLINTSSTSAYGKTPALWSNNRCLLLLCRNYFEGLWSKAVEASKMPVSENATALSTT